MNLLHTLEVRTAIENSVLCWLATVSEDGRPNVSPKELFAVVEDSIVIANIKSPKTARNIGSNPKVCVALLDVFVQKGVQLFGTARLVGKSDEDFSRLAVPLNDMAQGKFPFATLFEIFVTSSKPIISPRYVLYPETTEQSQIEDAIKSYGFGSRFESIDDDQNRSD